MTDHARGAAWMLCAALGFASMGVLVKAVSDEIAVVEIVFWRSLVALVVAGALGRGAGARLAGTNRRMLVGRGVVGVGSMLLYFTAIDLLPVGDAVLLTYLSPLFVASFSRRALGEQPSGRVWASLGLGLLGVIVVVGPEGSLDPLGVASALLGAVLAAAAYVSVRLLTRTDDDHTIVAWFSGVAMVVTSVGFLDGWTPPIGRIGAGVLAIGLVGTGAQYALTRAYATSEAARVSVYAYATPVLAYILGLLALGEVPGPRSIAGALIVVLAGWRAVA